MKVSLDWLGEHLDLSVYSQTEIDNLLTFAGIEVESIIQIPDEVVVAEIKQIEQHPHADKLLVCMVSDGNSDLRQIVCGAKNFKIGDKVPLALPGAIIGNKFTIKDSKLRGIESRGMLCSHSELGGEDNNGLWILPSKSDPGSPLNAIFPTIFELEITPNRPDCLSHLGIARELSALSGQKLNGPSEHNAPKTSCRVAERSEINNLNQTHCPLYTTRRIKDVTIAESPDWLKSKLESVGLRTINNIVDITNYVLMEMGQPLHAFDVKKLNGEICIRSAADKEQFSALDGLTYNLTQNDLVIADASQVIAIAGIMGGETTGITKDSTDVLLEAAYFVPSSIRNSSQMLGISSESSYRFERGVDPTQVIGASELATNLILEIAGGKAEEKTLICGKALESTDIVSFNVDRCRSLLGHPLTDQEMFNILEKLRLQKTKEKGAISHWKIPTYRGDLLRPVDLYEEIARVFGLDNISSRKVGWFSEVSDADRLYDFIEQTANSLSSIGFDEVRTIKLTSNSKISDCICTKDLKSIILKNPISDDLTHMRPGLIGSLLDVAERNLHQGAEGLRIFETGTVFSNERENEESQHLGLLLSGPGESSWQNSCPLPADFFTLRGTLERTIDAPIEFADCPELGENTAFIANILLNKTPIGHASQITPTRARKMNARHPIFVAEIDLGAILAHKSNQIRFTDLPKFPPVRRDIAMEVPFSLPNREIETALMELDSPLLESFKLFDLFYDETGKHLHKDKKSIAYSLTYRNQKRTLESSEIDTEHAKILTELKGKLPVKFR